MNQSHNRVTQDLRALWKCEVSAEQAVPPSSTPATGNGSHSVLTPQELPHELCRAPGQGEPTGKDTDLSYMHCMENNMIVADNC